ncbi:hypothetical protein L6164_018651 [Bauhinia variegata]|uniref:Uncharacterized protein n=1 Tax=Bauhinia variegata TaxID=167791 RepID=A0ACB9NBP5_BAUVA|nr:hypothetical protein L6164_018651 [Bauhinia variegata]
MEFHNEVDASKMLVAQTHIINHIFSYVNSMSLRCAVDLGIPDIIHSHGQPMPLSQLISSLPIHPSKSRYVYRLMRFLIHSGFFAQQKVSEDDPEEGYILTDASTLLLKDNPSSVTPLLLLGTDPTFIKSGLEFSAWFQNDDTTLFETANGMSLWEYTSKHPEFSQVLNEAMGNDATLVSSRVIEKCKGVFEGLESLVDVGGGTGNLAKAIAKEFPKLQCTVLDLPHVVSGLQGRENLRYVGGDMFKAIPPANATLFKWVLCDWSDEDCVEILKKCKEAIESKGKEGKVIIIDMVIENEKGDDESVETELLFDMMAMVAVKGRERNEKEWRELFLSAGFNNYKITPQVLGSRSVIEVYLL